MSAERRTIAHSRPSVSEREIRAVAEVLSSGRLAQGARVEEFEREMGRWLGLPPGVAVSSGSAALHTALLAMGIGPGDEVLLPSYVCVAPLLAVRHVGAAPVPVDVHPRTGLMDPEDMKRRITSRTRLVVTVHLFGLPACPDETGFPEIPVLEDCAQSLGAVRDGRKVGTSGIAGVTSFYATKLLTTGEGGMVFSRDERFLDKVRDLREYDRKDDLRGRFNYKMTDLAAAMGRIQLEKLEGFLEKRSRIAEWYDEGLAGAPVRLPPRNAGRVHYRYVVGIDGNPDRIAAGMAKLGIEAARPVFRPLHRYLGLSGYEGTEECWRTHLSLPLYPDLSEEDVNRVCGCLRRVLEDPDL